MVHTVWHKFQIVRYVNLYGINCKLLIMQGEKVDLVDNFKSWISDILLYLSSLSELWVLF